MFQFSGRSIRRDISFTAICILVSIRIIRMLKCTTMLPYLRRCSLRFFFFKTSAKAKLPALAWAQLQPMAAVGILQPAKWLNGHKRTITTICGIYSQTAATKFAFHPFHGFECPTLFPFLRSLFPSRTPAEQLLDHN